MSIFRIFRRNPFEPLKQLMEKIDVCVELIPKMLEANFSEDFDLVKGHFKAITVAEHEADVIKAEIRDNLPNWIMMPIDRRQFLEILAAADQIADRAEDLGYMLTIRNTRIPAALRPDFEALLAKSMECYHTLHGAIGQLELLMDSGFGGEPAAQAHETITLVCHLEWETDKLNYKLSQHLFEHEAELSPVDVMMIHDIARVLGKFADSSEKLAKMIRMTLAD